MLKIRMQRIGRTNMPQFRLIVAEHTEGPKTGKIVEKVGTYNPKTKEKTLDGGRIKYWLSVGAKASPTVHNMLINAGIISGKKINVLPRKSPPRVEGETRVEAGPPKKEEVTAKAAEAPTEETPAEEKKEEKGATSEETTEKQPKNEEAVPDSEDAASSSGKTEEAKV